MSKYSDEHLEYTIKVFQKYYPYEITKEKAEGICEIMVRFANPFLESEQNRRLREKNK